MKSMTGLRTIRSLGGERGSRLLMLSALWDVSQSMKGAKIQALNYANQAAFQMLQERKRERRGFDLRVLGVTFGNAPQLVIPPTSIDAACYSNLIADDTNTRIGPAFDLVAAEYARVKDELGVSPIEIVVTDGKFQDEWRPALERLKSTDYGSKARRLAVAIGSDADRDMLMEYLGGEGELLTPDKPEEIVKAILDGVSRSVSGVIQSFSCGGLNPLAGGFLPLASSDNT